MDIHPLTRVRTGIFSAALDLRDEDSLADCECAQLCELLRWFDEYLPEPTSFTRARRTSCVRHGVCWFKHSARMHLAQIWQMVALLERNGIWIRMLKAHWPGYVIYEDDWQIVAVPSLSKRR
jgi:hypothetical protein